MADFKAKEILLNAFDMNCVGHINHGLWTHPRDESHRFNELSYWTEQAKTLENGLFDGLFIADITGVYDVYQKRYRPHFKRVHSASGAMTRLHLFQQWRQSLKT